MDLRQLEVFKLITQTGSFSAAAKQLGVTQSALSHQIRSLEEQVGEQLLVRARPKIYPTAAGQTLLVSAARIFDELSRIGERFEKTRKTAAAGTVRVAATHIAITFLYGDLLEEFVGRHPEIEIVFHATETTANPVTRVLQRTADIGFTVLPQKHPKLEVVHLGDAEQVFIVGRKHPLAKQRAASLEEIKRWPFVRFEEHTGPRAVTDGIFLPKGGYPSILAESNDVEYVKRIVRMGLGVSLVPVFCVPKEIEDRTLHVLRLRSGRMMQGFGMVTHRDVNIRALDLFRSVCFELRGRAPRTISLENVHRPVFKRA